MKKFIFVFSACFFIGFFNSGCTIAENEFNSDYIYKSENQLKIANWNLQTFFDATENGTEYSGFTSKDHNWTKEKYAQRVKRLCDVIQSIDADIFCMEEIENKGILYDIANNYQLQGRRDKRYNYAVFAGEENQAFGIALISRYPIISYTVHQIEITSENEKQPQMRPVLNAKIQVENNVLSVYVCHWKSKTGTYSEEGKIWREYQENQLANLIQKDSDPIFITGDFNQDLAEFIIIENEGENLIQLRSENCTKLNSGWFSLGMNSALMDEGSYYYKGKWEKIDHVFYNDKVQVVNFCTIKNAANVKDDGTPFRYSIWNGTGYSDHLPIECIVCF